MPNWCENLLSIYGTKDEMDKIINTIKTEDSEYQILEKLYPTPADLLIGDAPMSDLTEKQIENKEKHGYTDWYEWRIDHWGTKWPESDLHLSQEYTEYTDQAVIAFRFETAWAPPIEAFNKISSDWPNILFCLYYQETGMGFCGRNVWANGECVEEDSADLITDYFDEDYLYNEYITKGKNNEQ